MRKLANVLTILTMAVLVILAILVAGTGMRPGGVLADAQPATGQQAAFDTIAGAILSGDMGSDQYRKVTQLDPANYEIITYRVTVKNPGILGADWVRLRLSPSDQDVALLATPKDIGPFGAVEVTAQLLTEAGSDVKRDIWIDYYMMGSHMSAAASWSENG